MSIAARVTSLRRSAMTGSFLIYTADFAFKIIVQLGYFLVISRALGVAGYGLFASVSAIAMLAAAFSGVGCDQVLIRRIARDNTPFSLALGNALSAIVLSLPLLIPLAVLAALALGLDGLTPTAVILVAVADIVANRIVQLATLAFQAYEQARPQLVISMVTSVLKLAAALLAFLMMPDLTLEIWAWWYMGSAFLAAGFALGYAMFRLGRPRLAFYPRDLGDGFIYSLEFASLAALRDLDKPVVADTLGPAAAGSYTAAFRLVDTSCVPIRALLRTTYVRYFHTGAQSTQAAIALARRVLPIMVGMSAVLAVGLLVGAGFVPWLIGKDYEPAVPIIRWMALYPLVLGVSAMGADLLRGLNLQRERLIVMIIATVTYIPIVWLGAELGGAEGAAIARMLSQALLLIATMVIIARVVKRATA